jgi:lariat debranching enzyme
MAPNIYFLDHAGCVQVNRICIAGASGIFKGPDFEQGMQSHMSLPSIS